MSRIQEIFHEWLVHKGVPKEEPPRSRIDITTIVVTRCPEECNVLKRVAEDFSSEFLFTETLDDALELKNATTAIVLVDRDMLGTDWRESLARLLHSPHRCCAILMSPNRTDRFCYEFIRHGGYSVLTTPLQEPEVADAVRLARAFWKACISRACSR